MNETGASTTTGSEDGPGGVSRRSVVKAGAHAAWAVPLVQVATAAPALAVSGPAKLQITGFWVKRDPRRKVLKTYLHGVKNTGATPAGQVTVVVRVPKTRNGSFSKAPWLAHPPSKGWTYVGRTGSGPWDFTFISDNGVAAGASTPHLYFELKLVNNGRSQTVCITATAFAPGVDATSASARIR